MSGSDLRIENLTKSYGSHVALDGVSIEVAPGEICGLLGPNGAGKTTLVSIISGLRVADSGRVTIGGQDIARGGRSTRALVGLAGQETGIYPTITVRANLELFAGIAGLSRAEQAHRMDELAAIFELEPLMDRLARNLSGGEKRRLHTAMSMLHRPPVLLLDEPTTGVDVPTRALLLDPVRRMAAQQGDAILYSTHYLPEIEELNASVAIIDHGSIIARGPVRSLIDEHGEGSVTIVFDGDAPSIPGCRTNGTTLTKMADDGGSALGEMVSQLGDDARRISGVDIQRANLESVFVALTGRRFEADDPTEVKDPPVEVDVPTSTDR